MQIINESDNRFYIAPSSIPEAGQGLFARFPLAPGDRLEVIGVLFDPNTIVNQCTHFADAYKFRFQDKLLLPLGYAGMVNHSDLPNLEKVIDGDSLYLSTLRSIEANEELFFSYHPYAQSRFLGHSS